MADNKIKGLYGTFVFVGTPVIPKEKFITTGNNDGGYVWKKIQFGIKTDDTNVGYLEMMGGYHTKKSQTIYSLDTKNNKLEIDWKDRLNDKIIASIADFKKIKVNFTTSSEKESKSYLAEYDAIEDIRVNLKADVRYVVVGNIKVDRYKDSQGQYKTSVKYIPTKIRLAKDDEANKTEATIQFVFDKDSWDESRFAEEKKVDILAYTTVYDKALKDNVFVPFSFVLNCEKLDMNNPAHKKMFDFYKGCFNVKSGEIYETQWHCKLFRGANEEEITMDDLSDDQKMQIELGIATFDEITKDMRGSKIGNRISEIRLIRPTNKYEGEMKVLTEYTEDDLFITETKDESWDEVLNKEEGSSTTFEEAEIFG